MKITLAVLLVILIAMAAVYNVNGKSTASVSKPKSLGGTISGAMRGSQGVYGIYIKSLKTGELFTLNEKRPFESGSLYKLWVMAETYKEIEEGSLTKGELIGPDLLSIGEALNNMITVSDNDSAAALTNRVGLNNLAGYLNSNGFVNSDIINVSEPVTTAADIGNFFIKLYDGQLAQPNSAGEMLGLLKAQTLNDMLPKFLPSGVVIAHKTADLDDFVHDAGIVYSPKGDYVIVVLSQGENPETVENIVASISKAVYNYFN